MLLGRVVGRVVATVKAEGLKGVRFLLVRPLDEDLKPSGAALVAADATGQAGPGLLVHYEGGREAALALDPWFVPVDHAVVGIVDEVIPEPLGGAHRDHRRMAANLKASLVAALDKLTAIPDGQLVDRRYDRFRQIGVFEEQAAEGTSASPSA